jgi:hypothetical protein
LIFLTAEPVDLGLLRKNAGADHGSLTVPAMVAAPASNQRAWRISRP